jgi:signal transduction histidine kinase/putative methionine-R-sulfoxide reductase with GAF domain
LLFIPLLDRKFKLIGALVANNKLTSDNVSREDFEFSSEDEVFGLELAMTIVRVVESLRKYDALTYILQAMDEESSLDRFLLVTLRKAVQLVRAYRGDFAWLRADNQLIIRAQIGEESDRASGVVLDGSVIRESFKTGQTLLIPDMNRVASLSYQGVNSKTKGEIAVPVFSREQVIGVLNIESTETLDEDDRATLEAMMRHTGVASRVVARESAVRSLVSTLASPMRSSSQFLSVLIDSVAANYPLDAAVIYGVDFASKRLDSVKSIGCNKIVSYRFEDQALATHVYNTASSYFTANPWNDPICNKKGLTDFDIRGPLLGVPLKRGNEVIGVLVCWSNTPGRLTEDHKNYLAPLAEILSSVLSIADADRLLEEALGSILSQLQAEFSTERSLDLILQSLHKSGFDRVRAFRYRERPDRLEGFASFGMRDPERFKAISISLSANSYCRHLKDIATQNQRAEIYDNSLFGADPNAADLEKDLDCPWAEVPLFMGGRFYGSIAADNGVTGKGITQRGLDFLTLVGALAAQAFANAEAREAFEQRHDEDSLHSLNTPIHCIDAIVEHLISSGSIQELWGEWSGLLRESVQQLVRLADSRNISADLERPLRLSTIRLDEIVATVVGMHKLRADSKALTILIRPESSLPIEIQGDQTHLTVALGNVLENAIRFSPRGGTITVLTVLKDYFSTTTVLDEGPGIAAEHRERIFDEYFLTSPEGERPGIGLGLPIARKILARYGGVIECCSAPDRVGGCFRIVLRRRRLPLIAVIVLVRSARQKQPIIRTLLGRIAGASVHHNNVIAIKLKMTLAERSALVLLFPCRSWTKSLPRRTTIDMRVMTPAYAIPAITL